MSIFALIVTLIFIALLVYLLTAIPLPKPVAVVMYVAVALIVLWLLAAFVGLAESPVVLRRTTL